LGAEQTAGAFCLLIDEPPAEWSLPAHRHLREAETIHVITGEFEMDVAGVRSRLGPGQTLHVPAGVVHAAGSVGEATGRRLVLFHPAGLERFFREVGTGSPSAPMDTRATLEAARRHGWEFVAVGPRDPDVADELTIRSARAEEADEILALWARAYGGARRTPDDHRAVRRLIEGGAGALLVADRAGVVVGSVIAAWDGWRGNLYRLAVAPEQRRQGIARRLVAAGEEHLRARGARRAGALVWRDDPGALALWRACGYGDEPRTGRHVEEL